MDLNIVKVKRLHDDAIIPIKAHPTDAGFDLHTVEETIIRPGETLIIKTGLAFEIPVGYEMQVRPRSGISSKTTLQVILGTVDCDYRGEVGIIVHNSKQIKYASQIRMAAPIIIGDNDFRETVPIRESFKIEKGFKLAQAVIQRVPIIDIIEVNELSQSIRGERGFGSTGV